MTNPRPNPYPGPRSFQRGEKLYGRARETAELLDLLIAERIVLVSSPSGAGKTSLAQAALVPELEREGFRVLPTMRPGLAADEPAAGANRYVLSLLLGLERDVPEAEQTPLAELAGLTLADYLQARWPIPESDLSWHGDVLIFDQFEEILSVDPTDPETKQAFFEQVGQALRDRNRWGLFSMREEYVAALDTYLRPIPARFDKGRRYRLDLLGPDAASKAMQGPAADQDPPVAFTDAAARKLADDLRRVQVQQADGTMTATLGQYIEPVQLQVVCRRLWDNLAPDDLTIDLDDLAAVGDVDTALASYYADTAEKVAGETKLRERAIRQWFDRQLITEGGIRGQVLKGHERSPEGDDGLANAAIQRLEDAHLVRAEQRRGATWFELAHDRLIAPVRADNAAWFDAHLSTLQRQAALWERQKRPEGLLLRDLELVKAEAWAGEHETELEEVERDFLTACQTARTAAEEKRRQTQRIRRWQTGAVASILGAVALAALAGFYLYFDQVKATRLAASRELAAQSANYLDNHYDLALLLSLEANRVADSLEARGSLLSALEHTPQLVEYVRDPADRVSGVAFSPDGRLLATTGSLNIAAADEAEEWTGTVTLWDTGTDRVQLKTLLGSLSSPAVVAAFSPDSKTLAVGCEDGRIHLWNLRGEPPSEMTWAAHDDRVNSVSFSPDGRWLASAGKTEVVLWDLIASGRPAASPLMNGEPVFSLSFGPDSRTLAVGYADGRIRLWDVATRQASELADPGEDRQANSLAFSRDGHWLASARMDRTVVVWDVSTSQPITLTGHTDSVETVAFSTDGTLLASGSRDKSVRLWDVATGQQQGSALAAHANWVMGVAFQPDSRRLASAGYDGNVILWDTAARSRLGRSLAGLHDDEIWAVAISPDGRQIASAGKDRRVVLWDLASEQPAELGRHNDAARAVTFSPDGATVASGGHDGYIRRWDIAGSRPVEQPPLLHAAGKWVSGVAFSPDGQRLASSGFDKTVKLWDLRATPPVSRTLAGHTGEVWSVAFSSDGKSLASSDDQGKIILWDVVQGKAQGQPFSGPAPIISVAFSPDGKRLASGSGGTNKLVIIWDIATRNPISRLAQQAEDISSVSFSPDGLTVASSSYDGSTILWDVATGRLIGEPLRGHTLPVNGLAYSRDGRLLADASDDHTVMVWDVDFRSWQARACQIANRNLTIDEWQQYVGTEPYRRTCPKLPGQDATP